jgi:hypothetical protein
MSRTELLPVPGGFPTEKKVVIDVSVALYTAARAEMRARKVKVRDLFHWALVNFLRQNNPREAERLGVS